MRKFAGTLVLGFALLGGTQSAHAAGGTQFYVDSWKPSKSKPSVVRAGIQVKEGEIDRWFVTTREECTVGDGKPEINKGNSYALNEKNLELNDGHFEFRYANKWSHTEVRSVFRGKIEADSVTALYRSRIRNHSPGREREKCRTGPLHFELERGSSTEFFNGFDPFSDK